jgi:REP element-mobilizing transposase RayT
LTSLPKTGYLPVSMKPKKLARTIDRNIFGGATLRNTRAGAKFRLGGTHAKRPRPLQHGEWLHVCLKSGIARGSLSMLRPAVRRKIEIIVKRANLNTGVRVSSWQNVGNHLHFSVKTPSRAAYNTWIRSISGLIARATLQKERGSGVDQRATFWESRPFTRIIRGFGAFDRLAFYIKKNQLEAAGIPTARAKEIVRMMAARAEYLEQTAPIDISNPPPA